MLCGGPRAARRACIGREHELGEIAVGNPADLAPFKLDELRFAGYGDALAAVVHGAAHRADRVMIAGHWAVEDGAIPGLDLPGLIVRQNEMGGRLQAG
jgi:8-oxoguanine deaminase